MEYIKAFNNHSAYTEVQDGLILPNVSYCIEEDEVHYNPYIDPTLLYLRYDSESDRYFAVDYQGKLLKDSAKGILYRIPSVENPHYLWRWICDPNVGTMDYYSNLYGVSDNEIICDMRDYEAYDGGTNTYWYSGWEYQGTYYTAGDMLDSNILSRIATGNYGELVEYNPPMYNG